MSIATLKRKSQNGNPRMCPISRECVTGSLGFALNGTRRIIGVVGETNLGSSNTSVDGVVRSCCKDTETTVKPSVKNTKGMLSKRYCKVFYGTYPCNVVQLRPDDSLSYTEKLHARYACTSLKPPCPDANLDVKKECHKCPSKIKQVVYTKRPNVAVSQSEYIRGSYLKGRAFLDPKKTPSFPNGWTPHYPPNITKKC